MIYNEYTLTRDDDRNWILEKEITAPRTFDHKKDPTKKRGDLYTRTEFRGFHSDVFAGLAAIVRDKAGHGCDDLHDLADQVYAMLDELKTLVSKQNQKPETK